jgi:hypothetical protein
LRELKDDTQNKQEFYIDLEVADQTKTKYKINWEELFLKENLI